MKQAKRTKLEADGWRVGTVREFLDLSRREDALVEIRVALARAVRERRERDGCTQAQLARRLGSSQSRIAKVEGGAHGVSCDLLISALLGLGVSRKEIGRILSGRVA